MRVTDKLALVDKLGRELQSRFTFIEIDRFLAEFGIKAAADADRFSKWVYSKNALSGAPDAIILRIAAELDLQTDGVNVSHLGPPRNWKDGDQFRLFISHTSSEKLKATRLKECLAPYAISGFVAHEDIHPTLEWQGEIERALRTMDAFIAIHTVGFSKSFWTQQEVGFACGRGAKVISFKMGEDPTGFISKNQALARRQRTAEEIAVEIDTLLSEDDRTSGRLAEAKKAAGMLGDEVPF